MKITGLVLAAGAGRRFGGPKALVALDGEPLVERAARLLRDGGCAEVVVVLGASAESVRSTVALSATRIVVVRNWEEGQGASLRAGLADAAGTDADAVVVALVDQPWVGAEAVRRLRDAFQAGAAAAVATYAGQPRNPVLLSRAVWDEVAASAVGDVGARTWLRANQARVTAVDCDGTGDPRDVDAPEDLEAADLVSRENDRVACVRYWAGAREVAGTREQSLPAASLAELLAAVRGEHGDPIARLIAVGVLLVDGERVLPGTDQPLADSSIVEILPPFAGG